MFAEKRKRSLALFLCENTPGARGLALAPALSGGDSLNGLAQIIPAAGLTYIGLMLG